MLKSGDMPSRKQNKPKPFFSMLPDGEFERHESASEAKARCDSMLAELRDKASGDEGWSEEVEAICWGSVIEEAQVTERIPRPPESELQGGCDATGQMWPPNADELIDYGMRPIVHVEIPGAAVPIMELVKRAVLAARPNRTTAAPRWVAVKDVFGVGSETAKSLCLHFGLAPYDTVPGVPCSFQEDEE